MLLRNSVKKDQTSPLLGTSILKPSRQKKNRTLAAALTLTSLIDAFTIMVLYLLVAGSGTPSQLELKGEQRNLPVATQDTPIDGGTVVRIDGDKYFVDGREIRLSQVAEALRQIQLKFKPSALSPQASLVIQADKQADFAKLTPIIRAGSISGFNKFKFAVIHEEG